MALNDTKLQLCGAPVFLNKAALNAAGGAVVTRIAGAKLVRFYVNDTKATPGGVCHINFIDAAAPTAANAYAMGKGMHEFDFWSLAGTAVTLKNLVADDTEVIVVCLK